MISKKARFAIIAILLCIATAGVLIWVVDGARAAAPAGIAVSGNIEVVDAELSFKMGGRVVERFVDEGEQITAGQDVARLDDAELQQELARRTAEVAGAQALLSELESGTRPQEKQAAEALLNGAKARLEEALNGARRQEKSAAKAEMEAAKADAERLRKDNERVANLFAQGAISQQKADASRAAYEVANSRYKSMSERSSLVEEGARQEQIALARAGVQQAEQQFSLVNEGARKETIDAARARLDIAKAGLAYAEEMLKNTHLTSPMSGVVLNKNIEPGEFVAPGTPLITVADLSQVFLRAYVDETDLGRVKLGQEVKVTTDTFPDKPIKGVISFIAAMAEFTPKSVQTPKERVKLVYRIKVDIPNPDMVLKAGMPADGLIHAD